MTEDELLHAVIDMCRLFQIMAAHFRPAQVRDQDGRTRWVTAVQGDGAGFPDLVLSRAGAVIFPELKSDTGRLSDAQKRWAAVLPGWRLWRPADLRSGLIEAELRALGDPQATRKLSTIRQDVAASRREPPAWLRADLRRRG